MKFFDRKFLIVLGVMFLAQILLWLLAITTLDIFASVPEQMTWFQSAVLSAVVSMSLLIMPIISLIEFVLGGSEVWMLLPAFLINLFVYSIIFRGAWKLIAARWL